MRLWAWLDSNYRLVVFLAALFAVAFILPVFFTLQVASVISSYEAPEIDSKFSFPGAVLIGGGTRYLRIDAAPGQNPEPDKDFILAVWFRIFSLPKERQRLVLLQKYDHTIPYAAGYALALERRGREILPAVYWRNVNKGGRWYQFSKLNLAPRDWLLLVISFSEGRILGAHSAVIRGNETAGITLLGGYTLEPDRIPYSEAPLILGSVSPSQLRAWAGPLGIFSGYKLRKRFNSIMTELVQNPLKLPTSARPEEVRVWTDGTRVLQGDPGQTLTLIKASGPKAIDSSRLKRGSPIRKETNADRVSQCLPGSCS